MLRLFSAASLALSLSLSPQASAQPVAGPTVDAAVEACLRNNAARVSAQAASLIDAANFLLENACAVEIYSAYRRVQETRFERMRARVCQNGVPTAAALQSDPGDDEDTAAFMGNYCSEGGAWSAENMADSVTMLSAGATATAEDRALAAQLILDARERSR